MWESPKPTQLGFSKSGLPSYTGVMGWLRTVELLAVAALFFGCGSPTPPPVIGSNGHIEVLHNELDALENDSVLLASSELGFEFELQRVANELEISGIDSLMVGSRGIGLFVKPVDSIRARIIVVGLLAQNANIPHVRLQNPGGNRQTESLPSSRVSG